MFVKRIPGPVIFLFLFLAGITVFQCRPHDEVFDPEYGGGLTFSTDSVVFDTVFTGKGTVTRRLKIFNPHEKAIKISKITLRDGGQSAFTIIIDGKETGLYEDLTILGKDSVLILIKAFIDPRNENNPFLIRDSLEFITNGRNQFVNLIAWGQDAHYLGDETLSCPAKWTSEKPYVIYASVLVDTNCLLRIEKGTRIYLAKNAFIYIKGSIMAIGDAENRIIFRNERLEPAYDNIPGQWGGILFLEGSYDNIMEFTVIRNGVFGIRLGTPDQDTIPDLVLKNTIIENMSNVGILAFTSDLYAENVLANNCFDFVCANVGGGSYTYKHCTFANYRINFISENPAMYISNYISLDNDSTIFADLDLTMQNSIIYGSNQEELLFDFKEEAGAVLSMKNNIFRSTIGALDTLENFLNTDPAFIHPAFYDYHLDTLSPAKDTGAKIGVLNDLDGILRDDKPDRGVYERIE